VGIGVYLLESPSPVFCQNINIYIYIYIYIYICVKVECGGNKNKWFSACQSAADICKSRKDFVVNLGIHPVNCYLNVNVLTMRLKNVNVC